MSFPSTPWRKIESLVETITPPVKIQKTAFGETGRFPIIDQSQEDIAGWTDDESALIRPSKPLVVFGDHTCAVKLVETPFAQGADGIKILRTVDTLNPRFLYYLLRARPLESSGYQRHFSKLKEHEIPLPPIELQKEIVAEIEGYQKVINGARAVLDNYRPHIPIHRDWPMVELGEVSEVTSSKRILAEEYVPSGTPFYRTKEIVELSKGHEISLELFISRERYESIKARFGAPAKGDLLVSAVGTIGVSWAVSDDREFYFKDGNLLWIRSLSNLDPYFLKHCLDSTFAEGIDHIVFGAAYKALTIEKLKEFKIPFPPLATQQTIVTEIESEQALVAANRELISRFEKKIQSTLARVWGEEKTTSLEE
jgi:type I restriction enzyme M protein